MFTVLSIAATLLLCMTPASFASKVKDPEKKVTFQAKEIKDLDKLIDRAKKGTTDLNVGNTVSEEDVDINSDQNEIVHFKVTKYKTAQLLKTEQTANGNTFNTYAVTTAAAYNQSKYKSSDAPGMAATAYSTIYIYQDPVNESVNLVRFTGGWTMDPNVYLTKTALDYGQFGVSPGGKPVQGQSAAITNPSVTYDVDVSAHKWTPVMLRSAGMKSGVTSSATVNRNGSSWLLLNENNWQG